ncbi:fasciclin domain-containing protein, partial [Xanthomonas citri pv. citri]|nr:fasciclin domain-containing protein [Xanthomonas citri pv. citri]
PDSKDMLTSVLTYHVVAGEMMAADLMAAIEAGGGTATLTTVEGDELTATLVDGAVQLTDARGGTAMVTATDLDQSNGVI